MQLSDLLTPVVVPLEEMPFVAVDPATRFVYVATNGEPERVDSAFGRVVVPMHNWQAPEGAETEEILKVLVAASVANPLKMPTPSSLDETFWVRQRGWKGLLFNPRLKGKFILRDRLTIVTSELIPADQVVLVGAQAGFYVRQGTRRGVVSNRAQSLMQVQFFTTG
jgi:hypothetical protein